MNSGLLLFFFYHLRGGINSLTWLLIQTSVKVVKSPLHPFKEEVILFTTYVVVFFFFTFTRSSCLLFLALITSCRFSCPMMFNSCGAISSGPIAVLKSQAEPAVDRQVTTMTDEYSFVACLTKPRPCSLLYLLYLLQLLGE